MEYDCPCGKKHRSRNTVHRHKKALAEKDVLKDVPKGQKGTSSEDKKGRPPGQSFIKEIDLQEEYRNMAEKVDPKKPAEGEPKYECSACGEKFNEKKKHCPGCGVEFA